MYPQWHGCAVDVWHTDSTNAQTQTVRGTEPEGSLAESQEENKQRERQREREPLHAALEEHYKGTSTNDCKRQRGCDVVISIRHSFWLNQQDWKKKERGKKHKKTDSFE